MLLHAQIASNKRKTLLIGIVFLALFTAVGAAVGLVTFNDITIGIVLAIILGGIYVLIMTKLGTQVVMAMNRAREITSEDDYPFLWNTVESLSIGARLPMPKVYIIEDPSPNAFAAGMSPKNAAVAVTTGLLDKLNREEIEAVLAHEMAHVQNYDVRIATTAIALVAVIGILSDIAVRMMWFGGASNRRKRDEDKTHPIIYVIALIFIVLGPIIAVLIQLALSRNREFLADASGAELCRNPNALASALRKISGVQEPMESVSKTCASLYFADPLKKKRDLFSTHPPAEERIRRLEQMM